MTWAGRARGPGIAESDGAGGIGVAITGREHRRVRRGSIVRSIQTTSCQGEVIRSRKTPDSAFFSQLNIR
ncbi:unnamed protein product [Haemonchus placei]|uniref:Uncharacterized protein n=1 Tax=Haemonchus placei TaxID=6290 RepID=A0A0N4WMH9_HAEPC|nr:unnamed protein product [Haemonchus placei]